MTRKLRTMTGAVLAAAAVLMTACSANPTTSTSDGEVSGSIRFSIWFGEGDREMWDKVIDDFESQNPGTEVAFEPLEYGAYWTRLNTQLAGGTAPDVIGMQYQQGVLGPEGQLEPLGPSLGDDFAQVPETLLSAGITEVDGEDQQYALPWRFVGGSLYGNLSAMEAAGVEIPTEGWTVDEFLAAAQALTTDTTYGTSVPSLTMATSLESAFGAAPVSADGKTATYDTPQMLEAKTFLRDLVWKYKVAPHPADLSTQADPFASGAVNMAFMGSWMSPVYRSIENFDWDILPNPSGSVDAKNYAGPDMISVTTGSKNKALAEAFVEFIVFDQTAQELIGQTGAPVLTDYLNDPARIEAEAAEKPSNYGYFVQQASDNGDPWTFALPQSQELGKLEADADFKILASADSDIAGILAELDTAAQAELDSSNE
ncbi:sugar ABC transporter substrate-binding protein [Herbiconiux sp. A18JL235]|uniref:Sugar ABC transporter substrate-binding protein n=1 Tax=Herbiconiux sp. A18JL235 TaxID=3152363 RepID=A0AB39BI84_9MICO